MLHSYNKYLRTCNCALIIILPSSCYCDFISEFLFFIVNNFQIVPLCNILQALKLRKSSEITRLAQTNDRHRDAD